MLTKQKENSFLPKNVEKSINDIWFFLHKWISAKDVINIVKLKFIKLLNKIWKYVILFFLFFSIFVIPIIETINFVKIYLFVLILFFLLFFIYLFFYSVSLSNLMYKNAYIIITNTHILLNWKIFLLNSNDYHTELEKIEMIFARKMFSQNSNMQMFSLFKELIFADYISIYNKKIWSIVILLLLFYSVYVILLSFLFFVWIIFFIFFSFLLIVINRYILKLFWFNLLIINDSFVKLGNVKDEIEKYKLNLQKDLKQAQKNKWEEWLLLKINEKFDKFNKLLSDNLSLSVKLKKSLLKSKFWNIYDFWKYENWLMTQLYLPVQDVYDLLKLNLSSLQNEKSDAEKLLSQSDDKYKKIVELQLARLNLSIARIDSNIAILSIYMKSFKK